VSDLEGLAHRARFGGFSIAAEAALACLTNALARPVRPETIDAGCPLALVAAVAGQVEKPSSEGGPEHPACGVISIGAGGTAAVSR